MSETEHDIALEDTDRIQGHAALVNNVKASIALAGAVRSTLGPHGLDKMLVEDGGAVLVTNDGVTVLETAKVEHPTARLLISASSLQDRSARDGTTTTILLTSELLQNSLELVRMGIHPSVILNGYNLALEESLKELKRISKKSDSLDLESAIVSTSLAGKIDQGVSKILTSCALEAASLLANEEGGDDLERLRVKRLQINIGETKNSRLVHGLVLAKTRLDKSTPSFSKNGKIAIIDGEIESKKIDLEAHIEITDIGSLESFHNRDMKKIHQIVEHISSLGINILIVRDGVVDSAITPLKNAGIITYRRMERDDIELLSKITGSVPIRNPLNIEKEHIGKYTNHFEKLIAGVSYTTIEGKNAGGMTFVINGTTPEIRSEVKRAFDDALGVAYRLKRDSFILPGGGASQIHLARHLRMFATTQSGREQLAIEAYAAALEIIPRVLAENSGLDPIDTLLSLSAAQNNDLKNGSWIGLDAKTGQNVSMENAGILEPLFVAKHALSGATEAAISVLRIDDVLWAKQESQTPDWQSEISED